MQIKNYTLYLVPPRWLLKIETNEGITGWDEPIIEGKAAQ
jgi:galactonate dehydratase